MTGDQSPIRSCGVRIRVAVDLTSDLCYAEGGIKAGAPAWVWVVGQSIDRKSRMCILGNYLEVLPIMGYGFARHGI